MIDIDENLLQYALDKVDLPVYVVDKYGYAAFLNKAASDIKGGDANYFIGKHILDIFTTSESNTLLKVLETGASVVDQEQACITDDGKAITMINSAYPIINCGDIIGAVVISKDITNMKQLVERFTNLRTKSLTSRKITANNVVEERQADYVMDDIVGFHPLIQKLKENIAKASKVSCPILIWGETGTGKELVAHALHNSSFRCRFPFVIENCSAVPSTLLENIFFGTVKGSFTEAIDRPGLFETADGGTVFLDEVASMPRELQSKLLRALETGKVRRLGSTKDINFDVKIISSLNIDPSEAVKEGMLRSDLYYRLNVIALEIPPLRERLTDIPLLVNHFINKHKEVLNTWVNYCNEEAFKMLKNYHWPGNVRELEHVIVEAMVMAKGEAITPSNLEHFEKLNKAKSYTCNDLEQIEKEELLFNNFDSKVSSFEKKQIVEALEQSEGNVSKAARKLNIPRSTLQYKLRKLNIQSWGK